jgi:hypothetical protein
VVGLNAFFFGWISRRGDAILVAIEGFKGLEISPGPSFPKRGNASLWKREHGRDFQWRFST